MRLGLMQVRASPVSRHILSLMSEPRTSPGRMDRWLSIAAGVGAICAVAVSLYQAALAREQQRASAWPYLSQSNSYVEGQPYTRQVENQGVGPARVRTFEVLVDGRPVRTWNAAMRAMTGKADSGLIYTSFGRGIVLPPGTTRTLLRLPPGDLAREFWEGAQTRLETVICYCSIYEECWRVGAGTREPVAVRACRPGSTMELTQ
jgi:hypothetical protein